MREAVNDRKKEGYTVCEGVCVLKEWFGRERVSEREQERETESKWYRRLCVCSHAWK